jgi:oligoribonuclease NrnB/cAMP/cGMP phosphodiesterase (DHH superfamily)
MSFNPFASMVTSTESKGEDTDSLGGNFGAVDTGLYDFTIKMAYAIVSKGGANGVVITLEDAKKQTVTMTEYISSGTAKGCVNFYIDKETSEKKLLPGYLKMDALALLATKLELSAQTWEEKLVPIYNHDAKSEVPTKVPVATSMLGMKIKAGVLKITENKTKLNQATNVYDPINESRDINEVSKVFHAETGKTIQEYREQKDAAEFLGKWVEKFGTKTIDKFKPVVGGATAGAPGAAAAGGGKPTASLF